MALLRGWFPESNQAPIKVGRGVLPGFIPSTNISDGVSREVVKYTGTQMDYDDGCASEEADDLAAHRSGAGKLAGMLAIEIKVS